MPAAADGNYQLDREGRVMIGTTSIFADYHVIQGLAEYNLALEGADKEAMRLLRESYDTLERNMFDPNFKDLYENTWSERMIWHDMYMTCLSCVLPSIPLLGLPRCERLLRECGERIQRWFYRPEYGCIFEGVTRDNGVDVRACRPVINPGHTWKARGST
jgi:N-acylglucosamine 2-epimerase